MERKRISASNIRAVGYDARGRVLEVEFSNGGIYSIRRSEEVHRRFMNAPSRQLFHDNIEENFSAKRCADGMPVAIQRHSSCRGLPAGGRQSPGAWARQST